MSRLHGRTCRFGTPCALRELSACESRSQVNRIGCSLKRMTNFRDKVSVILANADKYHEAYYEAETFAVLVCIFTYRAPERIVIGDIMIRPGVCLCNVGVMGNAQNGQAWS